MAIERQILANMQRAFSEGNIDQLRRASEFRKQLELAKKAGLVDYPDEPETQSVPKRIDREEFNESLHASGLGFGVGSRAIVRIYSSGRIGRLEDLSHLSDETLLRFQGLGKATLKRIREVYPFVPRA